MNRSEVSLQVNERRDWGILDRGTVVIVTDEERMILTADRTLTVYPREPTRFEDRHPRRLTVLDWNPVEVGHRWSYRILSEGKIVERETTEPVEEVRHVYGDLAHSGPRDAVDHGSPARRTEVSEVWTGDPIETSVTIWIETSGHGWDGTWVISGQGIGHHFVPQDSAVDSLTWPWLKTSRYARVGSTLRLDRRVGTGVWTPVDPEGCGTVTSIVIEEGDA